MRAGEQLNLADNLVLLCRRLRELRAVASALAQSDMTPLQICQALIENRIVVGEVRRFFEGLPDEEKHYWIASLYALLIPESRRRRLATYFTPPYLAEYVIDLLVKSGVRLGRDHIHDPASGGAAFLVPLASRMAVHGRAKGKTAKEILKTIECTLSGVEIEPRLARLSELLMTDMLRNELGLTTWRPALVIARGNSLKHDAPEQLYDAVVGNPPYGRLYRPSTRMLEKFAPVISDGYVNLYSLFVEHAIRATRPGGLICLIIPISFLGGSYFAALRKRILDATHVLRLDLIDKRNDVFLDVLYDVGILLLRKKGGPHKLLPPRCALLSHDRRVVELGSVDLPSKPSSRVWAIPDGIGDDLLFGEGVSTLADYGFTTKTGYFVWNREQHRYRVGSKPRSNEVPLYWAHNVRANAQCEPHHEPDSDKIGFVKIAAGNPAIVNSDAIVLQRTSNRRQQRRLTAGVVRKAKVAGGRGFVTENHTILVLPDPNKKQVVTIKVLCRLLNTAAVDARFRRMSGTVSVSTKALRELPLPSPQLVRTLFAETTDDERAAEIAYERSSRPRKANDVR